MAKKKYQEKEIIALFSRRRQMTNIMIYVALFCFAFIFTSRFIQGVSLTGLGNATEVAIALGIFTGAIIGIIYYWRCPNCRKFIGIKPKPEACPHCGAKLVEKK